MDTNPVVHNALQLIHDVVLKVVWVAYPVDPHESCHIRPMMECYNMFGGPADNDGLQNINIPETKESRDVASPDILTDPMNQLLNIRKVNIGIEENPKFASIGDYWDEETMEKTTDLLHEFQDLFPTKFYEMKWILGDLGQMKIPLKSDVKLVRQRLYCLNPQYKKRVKAELDRMLDVGIIELVEES